MTKPKRHPELNRLYVSAFLIALIWVLFRIYRILSTQHAQLIDAPSRWALLAVGLINTLAIGTLLFIVARNLAKLYFERRKGILGSRIRTRLVLALFGVCFIPSLLLFLIGQNFISKNVNRWFVPETQELIRDSRAIADAYHYAQSRRLTQTMRKLAADLSQEGADHGAQTAGERFTSASLKEWRKRYDLDLLMPSQPRTGQVSVEIDLMVPALPRAMADSVNLGHTLELDNDHGRWLLATTGSEGQRPHLTGGIFIPQNLLSSLVRLEKRSRESTQIHAMREQLETLPQNVFLLITLCTLFFAVWVGLTIARTISEPVRLLARAAQRIGHGDLDVSLPVQGEDELAFLSSAFNSMTTDLKSSREAIVAQAERLERQGAYLNQLLEALPVGILSWNPEGELRTFNTIARGWMDISEESEKLPRWEELAAQPRTGRLADLWREVRKHRRPMEEELRLGREGESRPVRAMVAPLVAGGELAVLEDLSLLAHAEKRAAWQEVARRMAHEVKNPLTPIKLTAQRLLRRYREGRLSLEAIAIGAETILAEVESISKLVDSFSRFAKLPTPNPKEIDATELMRQVEALYTQSHPSVLFTAELPNEPVNAFWDFDMVKRALINLVDNAISAMGDSGRIRLTLRQKNEVVHLLVEDEGPGVPPEYRSKLFEPYFSTKKKGTGLGLAITRRIAQDHDGEVFFEPLPTGSRFTILIPSHSLLDGKPDSR